MNLQWKAHVRAVALPPDHLALLTETGHCLFQGLAYLHLAPLLDGSWTDDEICARVEAHAGSGMPALFALNHLRALGLVREVDPAVAALPPAELAFWDALGQDAAGARRALNVHRVEVAQVGRADAAVVRAALAAAGLEMGDGGAPPSLRVVVANDYLDAALAERNRLQLGAAAPWMLVRPVGTVAWIGPLFVPGRTGCWQCLASRLRLNRQVESFVDRADDDGRAVPLPATPASTALAASHTANEVSRWLAMPEASRLEGTLLALDMRTRRATPHVLVRRPQCSECGRRASDDPVSGDGAAVATPLRLQPAPRTVADGGRGLSSAAVMARFGHHVSPLTGPVWALHSSVSAGYVHVAAAQSFPLYRYDFQVLRDNLRGRSGGKGLSLEDARASALCEALERYSGCWRGEEETGPTASRRALGAQAIAPARLLGFSATQYAGREAWNASSDEPHAWVPRPFDDDLPVAWTPLRSLDGGASALVPSAYAWYGHPELRHMFCASDSNGCAAGGNLTEAVAHGLLELVERDAAAIWWYNRLCRPALDLARYALPLVAELEALYARQGRAFWVLDLTTDLGVPVFAAISARIDGPREDIIYGFGCDFSAARALSKALLEMNQSLFGVLDMAQHGPARYRSERGAAQRWFAAATRANQPYLLPDPQAIPRGPEDCGWPPHTDWSDDVATCVERLRGVGLQVWVLDQTAPDIGLPVCRVVVPGLCHFWRRFGSARLFEVPLRMGWRTRLTPEAELNPWFIYF